MSGFPQIDPRTREVNAARGEIDGQLLEVNAARGEIDGQLLVSIRAHHLTDAEVVYILSQVTSSYACDALRVERGERRVGE